MTKKRKYLIDTSAVPVALGESTPSHCSHFADTVADGTCWTSIYVRKEFIGRWVRDYIRIACTVAHFETVGNALFHLEQDFRIYALKAYLHGLAEQLQEKGRIHSTKTMAKEFARLAVGKLRKFDRRFRRCPSNSCKCQIGGKELKVDFNHLFEDLRRFLQLVETVDDCPVNSFLGLGHQGPAARLLSTADVGQKTKSGKNLASFHKAAKWITCRECARIGDAVIVLDQSPSWCLVHIDRDFRILCPAANRENKPVLSERAVEKDAPQP